MKKGHSTEVPSMSWRQGSKLGHVCGTVVHYPSEIFHWPTIFGILWNLLSEDVIIIIPNMPLDLLWLAGRTPSYIQHPHWYLLEVSISLDTVKYFQSTSSGGENFSLSVSMVSCYTPPRHKEVETVKNTWWCWCKERCFPISSFDFLFIF